MPPLPGGACRRPSAHPAVGRLLPGRPPKTAGAVRQERPGLHRGRRPAQGAAVSLLELCKLCQPSLHWCQPPPPAAARWPPCCQRRRPDPLLMPCVCSPPCRALRLIHAAVPKARVDFFECDLTSLRWAADASLHHLWLAAARGAALAGRRRRRRRLHRRPPAVPAHLPRAPCTLPWPPTPTPGAQLGAQVCRSIPAAGSAATRAGAQRGAVPAALPQVHPPASARCRAGDGLLAQQDSSGSLHSSAACILQALLTLACCPHPLPHPAPAAGRPRALSRPWPPTTWATFSSPTCCCRSCRVGGRAGRGLLPAACCLSRWLLHAAAACCLLSAA